MGAFRIFRRLSELLDVAVVTPADGEVLAYNATDSKWENSAAAGGGGAPTTADYLVGTAQGGLSAEIVVGTAPGGELGGTWASPTVDATHSGSSHASVQAAAEATAASALSTHAADTTGVHGIADTSVLETTTGAQTKADAAQAASQPLDSDLTAVAGLSPTNDDVIQRKAGAWTNRSMAQLIADLAALGTTFQPLDSDLTALAGLAIAADTLPYGNGSHTMALTTLSSFIRTVLDDGDAATARATLGVIASLFQSGGAQAIALDTLAAPTDITTLNASTSAHGLLKKLDNNSAHFLDGTGAWSTPSASPPAGGSKLVYRYTVTGSDKASIDTGVDTADAGDNDWTGGDLLEIHAYCRTDESVVTSQLDPIFNNDSSSIYDWLRTQNNTGSVAAVAATSQARLQAYVPGASAAANEFGTFRLTIPNYTGTVGYKTGDLYQAFADNPSTTTSYWTAFAFTYRSTSAISRFKVVPNAAGKKLKVGSQLLVYKWLSS